ncbi:MAG: DUF1501 domain-containing protein [Actinobacteria bacterium]|nr:DUF1501 domain-containing protein [Actinomycetota bacterium]
MSQSPFTRRQLFRLGAGGVVVLGLGACDRRTSDSRSPSPTTSTKSTTSSSATTSTTATTAADGRPFGGRRLVLVQMNGGNDLLNTMPPNDGRYMDLRPTIRVAETDRVSLAGLDDATLHPSLAPLVPHWDAGRMAIVRGIGFEAPNRSHFVSMDRWWRADQLGGPGWLGVAMDTVPGETPPLFAAALGAGAPVLAGVRSQPTLIVSPDSFRFDGIDPAWIDAMAGGDGDDLTSAVRHAFARTVDAVADLGRITAEEDTDEIPEREGGATIVNGLALAAELLAGDVGTQVVVVSASGFDTHAGQVSTQAALLQDLADGLVAFDAAMDAAGLADEVMVVTTSEFGRRAVENGSGGTDHGAGGLSFVLGRGVRGGAHGHVDLGDLLDGDVRPVVDPLSLFTDCLEWLGLDPATVLPRPASALGVLR